MIPTLLIAATLTWTQPAVNVRGDTLTGYLRWEMAYSTQSHTWQAHGDSCLRDTTLWARVVAESAPRIVLVGYALAGSQVVTVAQPVISFDWPFTWWVRAVTGTPGLWSNPVTRAGN